jgi:hypothetical protein
MRELHNQFAGFELPVELQEAYRTGMGEKMFGPRNFTKVMVFATDNKIDNEIIDYYVGIKPERQPHESMEEYKNRSKFQKVLNKYRPYLYNYSSQEKK